jgi:hypothetical protein
MEGVKFLRISCVAYFTYKGQPRDFTKLCVSSVPIITTKYAEKGFVPSITPSDGLFGGR